MGEIMRNSLSIGTATITIKVIQVSGHKMTKATWRQIEQADWSVAHELTLKVEVFGWVRDGADDDTSVWLLWSEEGKLFRGWRDEQSSTLGEVKRLQTSWRKQYQQLFIAT